MTRHAGSMVVTRVAKLKLHAKAKHKKNVNSVEERHRELPSEAVSDGIKTGSCDGQSDPSIAREIQPESDNRKDSTWRLLWDTCISYWPATAHWVALLLIGAAIWGIVYSMTNGDFLPGSQLFSLLTLFVSAFLVGQVATLVQLPALLGMLLTGILLRNVGVVEISKEYGEVTASLREMALCVILIRAGLGLDPSALKSLSIMVVRLACVPSLVEGFFTTVMSHYLLGLPWMWGVMLAAILAAVSPAVVIPCLFSLAQRGYGTDKGIPTLVVAAASFDDILAISVFGVLLSIIFSTGDLVNTIIQGPLGVIIGIAFGIFWGILAAQVPHKNDANVVLLRSFMIGGGGLVSILGSGVLGYKGAGPLGCIVLAFVACLGWRRQGWSDEKNPVSRVFEVVWAVFQPILFGLIGSEVNISVLEGSVVGYGVLSLAVALFGRIVISIFIAYGGGFNWKEKAFVAFAWFPKATVQAALGPIALDIAKKSGTEEQVQYAGIVLIVAVLAILLTAPAGAVLISVLGPRLLTKVSTPAENTADTSSTPKENEERAE